MTVGTRAHIKPPCGDDNDEDRDGGNDSAEEEEGHNQPKYVRKLKAAVTTVATDLHGRYGRRACDHHVIVM